MRQDVISCDEDVAHRAAPIFLALLAALPVACSRGEGNSTTAALEAGDTLIDCATGNADFEHVCTVEQSGTAQNRILVVRRPDGGFRRFMIGAQGLIAADGAEQPAVTAMSDGRMEVSVGGERYRIPASMAGKVR